MSEFAMPADPQEPTQHIGIYSGFMEEIKLRTAAIDRYMDRFKTEAGAVDGFTDAESCILQVRYVCELIALSSAAVHNLIGITSRIRDSYQPGMIFKLLEGSNKNSFPRAVTYGAAPASYEFKKGEMDLAELKKVYNECGELLHRGALKHALAGKQREYAPEEILGWVNRIKALLNLHVVLMLDAGIVVLVTLSNENGEVQVALAQSDGPAILVEDDEASA
ncbi:hypothetical protein [Blastomonas aquatica]|uniref:HEPN AbiU2-like domain-containing protein n=1 Tax=Blastomonas aquatica TaxID=1510276 RepID=A0ABQ1JH67_9SPHN|nr:hypothetical protein [Blastomonas aquatica]GGB68894.1 hypothetical protein GCM10010833_25140 [Blastomonas aquatica]